MNRTESRTALLIVAALGMSVAALAQTRAPLDARVERALTSEGIDVGPALAALVESLAAGTPAYEFGVGRLRVDERVRFAFFRTVAPRFSQIIESAPFRAAYDARRADFTRSYESNPNFARSLERYFPADPRQLVADALRNLEEDCRDVDFRAATRRDESGRLRFVDPANEARSRHWKLCYRIGSRSMQQIRRAATRYRTELTRAGIVARPRE